MPYVPVLIMNAQPVGVTKPTCDPVMQRLDTWLASWKAVLARPDALLALALRLLNAVSNCPTPVPAIQLHFKTPFLHFILCPTVWGVETDVTHQTS